MLDEGSLPGPKWTRKAALSNMPVACCNRRGFSAEKRVPAPLKIGAKMDSKGGASVKRILPGSATLWGVSSAGRAPALQAGGHRFDPGTLHHKRLTEVPF